MKRIFFAALGALLSFSAWASSGYSPPDPLAFPQLRNRASIRTDAWTVLGIDGTGDWISEVSGTGAAFALRVPWSTNVYGSIQLQLGTVATNSVAWRTSNTALKLGGGVTKGRARVLMNQVSNTTDTYTFRWGLIDSGLAESTDAVMFRTTAATPFRWHCVTRAAGVETDADSFVTLTAAFDYELSYEINADASQVSFFINNTSVCGSPITTNIPTAELGFGLMALRSVGTAALNPVSFDYMEAEAIPTVRR